MKTIRKYLIEKWMEKLDKNFSILRQHRELNSLYGSKDEETFLFI
ncbi:hypothetical protein [Flagellimonas spongiicola]|nr:hypothetical protein [Allomuricauda spongiicola]